jgi:hypothetical protein
MKSIQASTEKYIDIKNKLQKLKYKLYFDISHTNMIEVLLTDITKYLTEIDYLKSDKEQQKSIIENQQLSTNALKQENAKLIKENNQLHREIIEVSKSFNNATGSRDLEIQRLGEEKTSLKFLILEAKKKIEKLIKENDILKHKHSEIVTKIYERNFNENTLRKLYSNNSRGHDGELDIYVKKKEMTQSSEFNFASSEGFENITGIKAVNETSSLRELIKETFERQDVAISSTSFYHKSEDDYYKKVSNLQNDILQLNNKIDSLENEITVKDYEINRLINIGSSKTQDGENDLVVKFLKQEKENLKEKYEKRIDHLINENRKLDEVKKKANESYIRLKNSAPYVNELLKEAQQREKEINSLMKEKKDLEIHNQLLGEKVTKLKEDITQIGERQLKERNQLNSVREEEHKRLLEENIESRELIETLDFQLKESRANSSSTNRLIYDELKFTSTKCTEISEEKTILKEQLQDIEKQHETCGEKINSLNQKLIFKERVINELNEKLFDFSLKFEKIEEDKQKFQESLKELNFRLDDNKKELILKNGEVERLENLNFILKRENAIYYKKIQNI